jgi:hypothetical protein
MIPAAAIRSRRPDPVFGDLYEVDPASLFKITVRRLDRPDLVGAIRS